jgi:hypothetical protein
MTDITKELIEDAVSAGFYKTNTGGIGFEGHDVEDMLAKFAELQHQRERQAVAVSDKWKVIATKLAKLARHAGDCLWAHHLPTGEGVWGCTCGLDSMVLDGELIDPPFTNALDGAMLSAAPPADTAKQEDYEAMKLDAERYRFLTETCYMQRTFTEHGIEHHVDNFRTVIGEEFQSVDAAIDAAMVSAAPDCPHPIVEELTKE